jgi:DDE superfamily endonuclease
MGSEALEKCYNVHPGLLRRVVRVAVVVTPTLRPCYDRSPIRLAHFGEGIVKNNLIVDVEERLVRYLSRTYPGSVHDKRICDEEAYTFPPGCVLFKDTGFQGYEPDNISTYQPKKKPRGQELTPADKAENTMISGIRILVEHVLAGVKRCHIVQDVFRNTKAQFEDLVMEIACGLHNFRAMLRYVSSE